VRQQFPGLEQRQAHDAGVAAGDVAYEDRRPALHRIAAGLVGGLAGAPVPVELGRREIAQADVAAADARCGSVRVHQRDRGVDLVGATREPLQHRAGLRCIGRLAEDLALERDRRVRRQHGPSLVRRQPLPQRARLGFGQPQHVGRRRFVGMRGLIERHGPDFVGNADLPQQFAAAWRGGGEQDRRRHHAGFSR